MSKLVAAARGRVSRRRRRVRRRAPRLGAPRAAARRRPRSRSQAAQGGDVATFDLKAALAKGPVVLYFFPKSFTSGCTAEAHVFSEHIADYKQLGAQVIGVSGDDIETQKKFSTQECRSAFLVASDPGLEDRQGVRRFAGAGRYAEPHLVRDRAGRQDRLRLHDLDPDKHVANTLDALKALAAEEIAAYGYLPRGDRLAERAVHDPARGERGERRARARAGRRGAR